MIAAVTPVAALLLSAALLLMGNGLQGLLLPVRANIEDFATTHIGLMGTAYYIGFGIGCYFGGRIVQRAGHIRTFSAMASLASSIALLHALYILPAPWWLFRAVTGFCFAVLYVVIESWLNERATNDNRGLILSIYNMINLTVITIGQMMLVLYDPAAFPLFALASILVSIAIIPLAMTTAIPPAPVENVRLRLAHLYQLSPVGCVGALVVGLSNGAFWTMGAVFAQDHGFDAAGIALFMSAAVLAGAVGQWPLGRLSDEHDRREIIIAACLLGALGSAALATFTAPATWATYAFVVLFGSMAFPLYALCVAHVNDFVSGDEFVEAASAMLLLYAVGAAVGPVPASILMGEFGPRGLFAFTAVAQVALAVFTLLRRQRRAVPPAEETEPFVGVPRTSPTLYALDPRSEEQDPAAPDPDESEAREEETRDRPDDGSRH